MKPGLLILRWFLRLAIAVGVVAAAGCAPSATRRGRAHFSRGYASFKAGRWERAVDQFGQFLKADPASPDRGEVYYLRGQSLVHLGRRTEARADFDRALQAGPRQPIDVFTRVAIGNLYFEDGHDREAVETYAQVLRSPPKEVPLERVLLRLAISLQRIGKWSMADKYLAYLIEHYPRTAAAAEGRRRFRAESFRVQTGAYASRAGASREAGRLREAGFRPRIAVSSRMPRPLHTVQVGKAHTYAEASALARRVNQAGFSAMVVP